MLCSKCELLRASKSFFTVLLLSPLGRFSCLNWAFCQANFKQQMSMPVEWKRKVRDAASMSTCEHPRSTRHLETREIVENCLSHSALSNRKFPPSYHWVHKECCRVTWRPVQCPQSYKLKINLKFYRLTPSICNHEITSIFWLKAHTIWIKGWVQNFSTLLLPS